MGSRSPATIRTSVILPKEAYERVQEIAEANDVSSAWVIRQAVLSYLESHRDRAQLRVQSSRMSKR